MDSQPVITEDSPPAFKIKVKLLSNQVHEFQVNPSMMVSDFKNFIKDKVGVPPQKMRIVFAGRQLLDDKPINQYISETGMTVHLIAKSSEPPQQQQTNVPNQQPSQQPNQQQPPNPFGNIMGMMGNIFGNGQGQTATVSFSNVNDITNTMNSMLGNLGMRMPQPPQPPQPPQQPQQVQPPQNRPENQPPRQEQNREKISYSAMGQLNQNLNRLNLPIDNVTTEQEVLNRNGLARYLRRLQHQNTRALSQLNRAIALLEEGNTNHLNNFIPVFESLNQSNSVAIQSIKKVIRQEQVSTHQNRPQNQPQRVERPQTQQRPQIQQRPAVQPPIGNMFGGFDIGQMLGSIGGMQGLFSMTIGQMMEENEGSETRQKSIIIELFYDINGQNVLQSFTSKDFSYLNQKHPDIRTRLMSQISKKGRDKVIQEISQQLAKLFNPQDPTNIKEHQKCKQNGQKIIKKHTERWVDLTLQQKPQKYSDGMLHLLKQLFGEVMTNNISHMPDEGFAFATLKKQTIEIISPFIPGLADMFYMLIERQLFRIFKEYKEELKRKQSRSIEEEADEEELIKMIKQNGGKDGEYLQNVKHSREYEERP